MKTRARSVSLLVFLACSVPARADSVLVGTTGGGSVNNFELTVGNFQFIAQSFSLSDAVSVSDINLFMSGFGSDQFTVQVTDTIGPSTTPSDLLFQAADTFPDTGGAVNGMWVSTPANLFLGPGDYFLVLSSNQPSTYQGWVGAGSVLPSSVGSVGLNYNSCCNPNHSLPPASSWIVAQGPEGFQIVGTEIPEPNPLLLLSSALAISWGLTRRRRRTFPCVLHRLCR